MTSKMSNKTDKKEVNFSRTKMMREVSSAHATTLRPKSYRLFAGNLPIEDYLVAVDRLLIKVFYSGTFVCNTSGQLVLQVCKTSNRIFLLKDLTGNTLWQIQREKSSEVDVQDVSKGI